MAHRFFHRFSVTLLPVWLAAAALASPWLYGVHWYGDPNADEVETMTGGKGIWTLETIIGGDTGQVSAMQRIVAKGHSVIGRVQPAWGLNVPTPQGLAGYLDTVEAVVRAYAETIHIWQIGNEPNLYLEYDDNLLEPEAYIEAYKAIRQRIKTVASPLGEQIVLVAAVSPGPPIDGIRHTHGSLYLQRMCRALTPADTDGFAIHSYAASTSDVTQSLAEFKNGYVEQLRIIDNEGYARFPAFMTEWNRQVNPPNAVIEATSALFLRHAYAEMDAWNRGEGNHPIVCACWFVYRPDPQWTLYSIRYLRDFNPRGANNDLYDAFQAAAQQDYRAGAIAPVVTPSPASSMSAY